MKRRLGLPLAIVLAAGCSAADDNALAGDDDTTGGGPEPGTSGLSGTVGGSGGTDDPSGITGADTTGDETGNDTGPAAPESVVECEGIDCGSGSCVLDRDGRASCLCADTDVAAGLQCLTCTAVAGSYDISVEGTDVSIAVTFAGAAAPAAPTETATLALRDPASGELIPLGDTHAASLSARVLPTGYELVYGRTEGAELPANTAAVLGLIDAKGTAELTIEVDLRPVRLTGTFAFDGDPAPDLALESGQVYLRNPATGDQIHLGETRSQTYDVPVLPGTYAVEFEFVSGGTIAPLNRRARVGTIEVPEGEPSYVADIDILTTAVSGGYAINGAPAPQIPTERGRIWVRDRVTGDEFAIGDTDDGGYTVRLVRGSYDVMYQWVSGSSVVPANSHALLGVLDTEDPGTHTVQIATTLVSGSFTIDGAPPPANANDDGRLSLRDVATGDVIELGNTTAGGFDRLVVTGAYSVHYAQDTSSGVAPANANARLSVVDVGAEPNFDIDVPTAFISGAITIGLGAPPNSEYDDGWVYLRAADGDTVLLANTRMGLYGVPVVPGTYDVVYAVETPGGQVPINLDSVVVQTIDVVGATVLDIDIPVRALGGDIGNGGGPGERGSVYLEAVNRPDRSLLGNTVDASYGQRVIPGRYVVSYGVDAALGGLPVNTDGSIACIDIMAP